MKMRYIFLLYFLLISFLGISQKTALDSARFKIVGYYVLNHAVTGADTVYPASAYSFLDVVTHLNIAFINPDSAGNFNNDIPVDTIIYKAHQKGVKVLASIGGGGPHPYYKKLLQNGRRKAFVANLVSLVQRYRFDGVDVDIEGSDIDDNYENFVTELAAALQPVQKLMTAAIATAYKDQLSDNALRQFDFVNVMSYDATGPWRPDKPGNHSPYAMAEKDLDYWHNSRHIPITKLVLGLPFYGYGFGKADAPVLSLNYNEIVAQYPNHTSDTLYLPEGITLYYNSYATIKKKTELAIKNASGVMVWQLFGDASGAASLLHLIDKTVRRQ